jgi:hypothetical protein
MEAVMTEVLRRCAVFQICYKLYADDVIITVSHEYLEYFFGNTTWCIWRLLPHYKREKFNIFAVKKHLKIDETMDLKGIPVIQE